MALKEQQYQILKAKDTRALGTSLLIIPCLGTDQKARGLWERDWKMCRSIARSDVNIMQMRFDRGLLLIAVHL